MNRLNQVADTWAEWMLHAGWQAALVAVVVLVVALLARRKISAQFRYALLLIVLVKFALPPFVEFPTGVFSKPRAGAVPVVETLPRVSVTIEPKNEIENENTFTPVGSKIAAAQSADAPVVPTSNRSVQVSVPLTISWSAIAMCVYLSGTMLFLVMLMYRYWCVRRIVLAGEVQHDGLLHAELTGIAGQLGIRSVPELRTSDDTDAPFAFGAFRPVIVMPSNAVKQLKSDQLGIVIAHELVHIRRRDLLVGWIETLLTAIWWFHPAMWWLKASLRQTREDCCDDVLVADEIAQPERYCETLIDAAASHSRTLMEPVVLGFSNGEHPAARRIRRLMDDSVSRTSRLRKPAIAVALLLAAIALPGMQKERQPVTETTLRGAFGSWRNLPFKISEADEAAIKECREISSQYNDTYDRKRVFDRPETRDKLQVILEKHSDLFYAQHLLATWHRNNGNVDEANRLFAAALANAPGLLTQRYATGDGEPVEGVQINTLEVECNRVQRGYLDPSLQLRYVGLRTDANGNVSLPVYDTVFRMTSRSSPQEYESETKNLGWFESKAHTGVLPEVLLWKPGSQPRNFTRAAADAARLAKAKGTEKLSLKSGGNTWRVGQVARAQEGGTFAVENGKGEQLESTTVELPDVSNAAYMDHAVIDLVGLPPDRYEIGDVEILDAQTCLPLQKFQNGAGYVQEGKGRIRLFSMWDTLPDAVTLVLDVYNYRKGDFRHIVPAEVDAEVEQDGAFFQILHLDAGEHDGWSDAAGFVGEPKNVESSCEIVFRVLGNQKQKLSVWLVQKDGTRWNLKPHGWYSAMLGIELERIMAPLDNIDHFEILPYRDHSKIYFANIQLPARHAELKQDIPAIKFDVVGLPQKHTADTLSPMRVHFESFRGDPISGTMTRDGQFGFSFRPEADREVDSKSTVTWVMHGGARFDQEFTFFDGMTYKKSGSSTKTTSVSTVAGEEHRELPLESIESVELKLIPVQAD